MVIKCKVKDLMDVLLDLYNQYGNVSIAELNNIRIDKITIDKV